LSGKETHHSCGHNHLLYDLLLAHEEARVRGRGGEKKKRE